MAEIGKLEITVLDMPKIQRLLKRYEKIQRRVPGEITQGQRK